MVGWVWGRTRYGLRKTDEFLLEELAGVCLSYSIIASLVSLASLASSSSRYPSPDRSKASA